MTAKNVLIGSVDKSTAAACVPLLSGVMKGFCNNINSMRESVIVMLVYIRWVSIIKEMLTVMGKDI